MTTLNDAAQLGAKEQGLVVISTSRADGTIQSSLVNAGVMKRRTLVLIEPTRIYSS